MKKIIFSLFALTLLITNTLSTNAASASSKTVEILPLENGYEAVITTEICEPIRITRATSTKTFSRTYDLRNSSGKIVASYKLIATFQYDGSTSSCISATHSTSIFDNAWEFTGATSSRTGNKAVGNFSAQYTNYGVIKQTITDKVTLTCDKNGNIS